MAQQWLVRKPGKGALKSRAHIWDGCDTACTMFTSGSMNERKYHVTDSPGDHLVCTMCKTNWTTGDGRGGPDPKPLPPQRWRAVRHIKPQKGKNRAQTTGRLASPYDPGEAYKNRRDQRRHELGTFGPASAVRHIDPKDWKPTS